MANEFVAKNGLISQNNTIVSGSLTVTQGITGSLSGSVVGYVANTVTSSFATTGSNIFIGAQTITGSGQLIVKTGTTTGILQQTTDFGGGAGSNIGFGLAAATGNTYGTVIVRTSGGAGNGNLAILSAGGNVAIGKTTFNAVLDVNGNAIVTGSLRVTAGITGSLFGTASYITASAVDGTVVSASYALTANTASYITASNVVGTVLSASYAVTASYAMNGGGGGGGGITQGQVVAIATGNSNLF